MSAAEAPTPADAGANPSGRDATRPKRKRLPGPQRRETFLDAAAAIVAATGVESLTMEGAAAHLGVNKALGYRYFKNRDDLLLALFERESERFDRRVADALRTADSLESKLGTVVTVYLEAIDEGSVLMTQFEVSRYARGVVGARRSAREVATMTFLADLVREEIDIDKRTAFTAAAVLAAGVQGIVAVRRATDRSGTDLVDTFVTMCLASLHELERG